MKSFATVCLFLFVAANSYSEALEFYVARNGDDNWSGTLAAPNADGTDGPVATLTQARDRQRAARAAGQLPPDGARIYVREGNYTLSEPLRLGPEDSGTSNYPVIWSAYPGESISILGARLIPEFSTITDEATLLRLNEAARGKVVSADLKALGVTDFGTPGGQGLDLIFNHKRMKLSRWPNEGFVKIAEEAGGDKIDIRGRKGDRIGKWEYAEDRPNRWSDEAEVWVHGYWFWDWSDQRHKVKAIDTAQRTIEVEPPYHGYGYRKGQWYYAYNLLSEIDEPGEWYLDRNAGVLYFWPPEQPEPESAMVTLLSELLVIENASHVQFQNLTFEGSRNSAVRVHEGENVQIIGCTARNLGGNAIGISGGTKHRVADCELYNLGGGGISLRGGARESLTPAGHVAENNHIHDYGQWFRMYRSAISISGVGIRVAHNYIHDAPHMAIGFSGNEHLIEYNEIHDVCLESNDAGAIYSGRDWTMRGTVIRYNYLHNITGYEDRGCVGVYLDDMFCGTEIYGNLFYRSTRAAFIGGGRDVMVKNNLFVDCDKAMHIDNRAQGWASDHIDTTMPDRLNKMPYLSDLWRNRYPALVNILEDEPAAPKGNRIERNVSRGGRWDDITSGARQYQHVENNSIVDGVDSDDILATLGSDHPPATAFQKFLENTELPDDFQLLPLDRMGMRTKQRQ